MPLGTDILIDSFGFIDRPTLSFVREVCDEWRTTIDAASRAVLPLLNITKVDIKQTRRGLGLSIKHRVPLTADPRGDGYGVAEDYKHRLGFVLEGRDTPLDKGLERMQNLLRNAFVASFRIEVSGSASTSLAIVRRQLHNCRVDAVFLDCWHTADVEEALQTVSANWGVERFTLRIDISHLEGFIVNNVFQLDCVQRSKRLSLVLTMLKNPVRLTSDWISALRTLRECQQVDVKYHVETHDGDEAVVDASGIQSIVKDILEMFLENPLDFPGQLSLLTDNEDVFEDLSIPDSDEPSRAVDEDDDPRIGDYFTRVSTGAAVSVVGDLTSVSFYRGKLTEEGLEAHYKKANENARLDDFYFPIF